MPLFVIAVESSQHSVAMMPLRLRRRRSSLSPPPRATSTSTSKSTSTSCRPPLLMSRPRRRRRRPQAVVFFVRRPSPPFRITCRPAARMPAPTTTYSSGSCARGDTLMTTMVVSRRRRPGRTSADLGVNICGRRLSIIAQRRADATCSIHWRRPPPPSPPSFVPPSPFCRGSHAPLPTTTRRRIRWRRSENPSGA